MPLRVLCPQGHTVIVAAGKVGHEAACPLCFSTFLVELNFASQQNASKEDRKPRRSRDDDDEDEDDEDKKPQKKAKPSKSKDDDEKPRKKTAPSKKNDEDDDEDERPRKKKSARKDEDDDDEDDDEDEDDGEEEEEIEWTPRKRQLNIASNALIVMTVATYLMIGFGALTGLAFMVLEVLEEIWTFGLLAGLGGIMLLLSVIAFVVSLVMSFMLPAKAEGRGPIIAGLVFWGLYFFQAILAYLVSEGFLMEDPERQVRMANLLYGGSTLCFILGLLSTMAYLSKLMIFMRMNLEASQPITNGGFIILCYALMFGVVYAGPMLKSNIGGWMCYIVALVAGLCAGVSVRILVLLTFLIAKVRGMIAKYIREA